MIFQNCFKVWNWFKIELCYCEFLRIASKKKKSLQFLRLKKDLEIAIAVFFATTTTYWGSVLLFFLDHSLVFFSILFNKFLGPWAECIMYDRNKTYDDWPRRLLFVGGVVMASAGTVGGIGPSVLSLPAALPVLQPGLQNSTVWRPLRYHRCCRCSVRTSEPVGKRLNVENSTCATICTPPWTVSRNQTYSRRSRNTKQKTEMSVDEFHAFIFSKYDGDRF